VRRQTPATKQEKAARPANKAPGKIRITQPRYRALFWLIPLVAFAIGANLAVNWMLAYLGATGSSELQAALAGMLVLTLVAYGVLIAIPFVPGVEIGVFLLVALGAPVAPYVYLATLAGLSASYLVGRFVPVSQMCRLLGVIGLHRACAFMLRVDALDQDKRLALIKDHTPAWIGPSLLRYRYLVIALGLNLPGNALIGGGGGIALMAGLSRIFSPLATILTIAVAVTPVTLAVYAFGTGVLAP